MIDLDDPIFDIDKIRIFICDEEGRARSECWYFMGTGDSVYIGSEATGGTSKLSFHPNDGRSRDGCNSQWGLIGDYARKETELGTPNLLRPARWTRPETPQRGAVQVASITFPTALLAGTIPPFKANRKRIGLRWAPVGRAVELGVFYSREAVAAIEAGLIQARGKPIAYISLR